MRSEGGSAEAKQRRGEAMERILWRIAPWLMLALAVSGALALVASRPEPAKATRKSLGTPVEVMRARLAEHAVLIEAQGQVEAEQRLELRSEIAGRITWVNPALREGRRLKRGAQLLRLDAREYQAAWREAQAAEADASLALQQEEARVDVAKREWAQRQDAPSAASRPQANKSLALREPQLTAARARLEAAQAAVERAQLNVERTRLKAPFDALVLSETVEAGRVVSPGETLVTLAGTAAFRVDTSLPVEKLRYLSFASSGGPGSAAKVSLRLADQEVVRDGVVDRLAGEMARAGRMARVIVRVPEPFRDGEPPLLLGAFAHVELSGGTLEEVIAVPRQALRDEGYVFVVSSQQRLDMRLVDIAWSTRAQAYLRQGVTEGERVVTSLIAAPAQGMPLRIVKTDPP